MVSKYKTLNYHIMLFPAIAILAVFNLYPLLGSVLAFKKFMPKKGIWLSEWVGFDNFERLFLIPKFTGIIYNTVFISVMKIILGLVFPLIFALLLNEVRKTWFRRTIQTITYLPYFLSWVILAGVFKDILSSTGVINGLLGRLFGMEPYMFFAEPVTFPYILALTDTWKNYGFNAIIYLATLTSIDVYMYEAARIDGASRWQQLLYVTLPSLKPTVILLLALSLQSVLNAGFEQVLNLYNPVLYDTGDILDTYIYRMGLIDMQFEIATAVGLMKSMVGFILIYMSQILAKRYANYEIF